MPSLLESAVIDVPTPAQPRAIALVGVSGYARFYLEHLLVLQAVGRVKIVAAAVINRADEIEAVARLQAVGCQVFDDFDSMLAGCKGRIDVCCLPVAIASHARLVAQALRAGIDVLVEKPLTATLADAVQLHQEAAAAGRFVAVGFQDIYNPATHRLKRCLCDGRIGRVRRIRIIGLWPRGLGYYKRNAWAGRASLNGEWVNDSPCSNAFAHFLNLALFLASSSPVGVACAVSVEAERYRCQPIETFDTVLTRIATDTGVDIHLQATHSGQGYEPVRVYIDGDAGRAEWTHLGVYRVFKGTGNVVEECVIGDEGKARDEMFARVLARCADKNGFIFDAALASEHVRLVQAIHLAGPVHDVPAAYLQHDVDAEGRLERISIPGLNVLMEQAFVRGCSLQDLDCAWAMPRFSAPPEAFGINGFPVRPPAGMVMAG